MNGLLVTREIRNATSRGVSHIHEFYEIYYLINGQMRYLIEDELYNVCAGDVVFIPKGVLHNTTYDNSDAERYLINFSDLSIADETLLDCFEKRVLPLSSGLRFDLENLLAKLEREYHSMDVYSERLVGQYLNEILIFFTRIENYSKPKFADGNAGVIRNAIKYINENYANDITLAAVAAEFALSRSFFSRKFKEISGFGFNEYLTLVRVSNAEKLLSETDISVTEAALACGFNDSSYFAAVFKRMWGITPYKYAQSKRNGYQL